MINTNILLLIYSFPLNENSNFTHIRDRKIQFYRIDNTLGMKYSVKNFSQHVKGCGKIMLTDVAQEKTVEYGTPDYDGLWKKIIADLFEEFMLFLAPDLYEEIDFTQKPDYLQQELYKKIIQKKKGRNDADLIVKVFLKNGKDQWILIHIEVQEKDSSDFPERMFRYFYRIYDKFDRKVYAIALMTNDKESGYCNYFHYNFFGTMVDYKYPVYRFNDHSIEELEQSNNPFAIAVIAGKYASKHKTDVDKRFYFKRKLMIQILRTYSQHEKKPRTYIIALFYFIDYLLQLPGEYSERLDHELIKTNRKDGEQGIQAEKEILSPTLTRLLNTLKEQELAEVEKRGIEKGIEQGTEQGKAANKETVKNIAIKLIKDGFQDEKIKQLTELTLKEITELRKSCDV